MLDITPFVTLQSSQFYSCLQIFAFFLKTEKVISTNKMFLYLITSAVPHRNSYAYICPFAELESSEKKMFCSGRESSAPERKCGRPLVVGGNRKPEVDGQVSNVIKLFLLPLPLSRGKLN
jgi:hypothetical protein